MPNAVRIVFGAAEPDSIPAAFTTLEIVIAGAAATGVIVRVTGIENGLLVAPDAVSTIVP